MALGEQRRVAAGEAAEQAEALAAIAARDASSDSSTSATARATSIRATASPRRAGRTPAARSPPIIARLRRGGELDHLARIAAEAVEHEPGQRRARRMPSWTSSASCRRSRPMRAPLPRSPIMKPPAADRSHHARRRAHHIDAAGAQRGNRAVSRAKRAFQRDQRVALDDACGGRAAWPQLPPVGADIASSQAEQRRRRTDAVGVDPGLGEGQARPLPRYWPAHRSRSVRMLAAPLWRGRASLPSSVATAARQLVPPPSMPRTRST